MNHDNEVHWMYHTIHVLQHGAVSYPLFVSAAAVSVNIMVLAVSMTVSSLLLSSNVQSMWCSVKFKCSDFRRCIKFLLCCTFPHQPPSVCPAAAPHWATESRQTRIQQCYRCLPQRLWTGGNINTVFSVLSHLGPMGAGCDNVMEPRLGLWHCRVHCLSVLCSDNISSFVCGDLRGAAFPWHSLDCMEAVCMCV